MMKQTLQHKALPGTTLRVWLGGYWHYGILVHGGRVIHNSKQHGHVVEEPINLFSEGRPIETCSEISSHNLLLACLRARQLLGVEYSLFTRNCEHFVRVAHGLIPESPQVQKAVLATSGFAIAATSSNPRVQLAAASAAIAALLTTKGSNPAVSTFWGAVIGSAVSLAL
ncbi:MAG: hypothetical protein K0S46_1720 [Moraxellaceae bacterium]|jgi:hypothetical protein|nr:hypothetical protein [Moraxellaceae bacterium]